MSNHTQSAPVQGKLVHAGPIPYGDNRRCLRPGTFRSYGSGVPRPHRASGTGRLRRPVRSETLTRVMKHRERSELPTQTTLPEQQGRQFHDPVRPGAATDADGRAASRVGLPPYACTVAQTQARRGPGQALVRRGAVSVGAIKNRPSHTHCSSHSATRRTRDRRGTSPAPCQGVRDTRRIPATSH